MLIDPDWSLHGETSLHLIYSQIEKSYLIPMSWAYPFNIISKYSSRHQCKLIFSWTNLYSFLLKKLLVHVCYRQLPKLELRIWILSLLTFPKQLFCGSHYFCVLPTLAVSPFPPTPSFPVYKAYTYIKIQTFSSLTNNLTIKFLFL